MPEYELRVGGSAGNAALALAALGVPFRLLANAGDDVLGRWLRDSFGSAALHWRLTERPTTVSVGVTHPNGERTFLTNEGHLEELGPADVLPHLNTIAPAGSVALLCGVFLSPPLVAALGEILAVLKAAGYRVALDTGWPPAGWTDAVRSHLAKWLPAIDLLLTQRGGGLCLGAEPRARSGGLAYPENAAGRFYARSKARVLTERVPGGGRKQRRIVHLQSSSWIRSAPAMSSTRAFWRAEIRREPLRAALAAGVKFASAVIATHPRRYEVEFEPG